MAAHEIVVADIGGTHARFALATVADKMVATLGPATLMATAGHASLATAWEAFAAATGRPLPRDAAIAVAYPVAGDIALTQGGFGGVVVAGGIGLRLADHLPRSGFAARFVAKGRFAALMATIPVRVLVHPQPGLFGAAAAFAEEH